MRHPPIDPGPDAGARARWQYAWSCERYDRSEGWEPIYLGGPMANQARWSRRVRVEARTQELLDRTGHIRRLIALEAGRAYREPAIDWRSLVDVDPS